MSLSKATFTEGSIMRHVITMASTGAVGLVAIFVVDLANLFYISLLGQRELAAAIGYASTLMFFAVSICIGFTIAATAVTAKAIGKGDETLAKADAGTAILFIAAASTLISIFLYIFVEPFVAALGAVGETKQIAVDFLKIAIPSIPLLGVGMCLSGLLRAKGDAKRAMYVTLSAGIAAAFIDPLLIFYFDLGITGAAISIVLTRLLLVLVGLHGTWIVHNMISFPNFRTMRALFKPFIVIGLPAVLTQIATPFGNAYVTRAIAEFGDDAVAGWAIVGRIVPLAFAATFSLSGAVGPILAQNYGAGLLDRVSQTMKDSLIFILIYVFAMWALLAIFQNYIITVFGASGDAQALIQTFCIFVAGTYIFTGSLFVANAAFNNLGNPILSTIFNWGRATLGVVPFVYFAKPYGPEGILIAWSLGGALFGIAAIFTCFKVLNKLPSQAKKEGIEVHQTPATSHLPFTSGRGAGLG